MRPSTLNCSGPRARARARRFGACCEPRCSAQTGPSLPTRTEATAAHFYDPERGDQILNPFDVRAARWSLFGELEASYDIDQLARALIPEHGDASAREWKGYARTLFCAITRQLHDARETDLALLYRLLTSPRPRNCAYWLQAQPPSRFSKRATRECSARFGPRPVRPSQRSITWPPRAGCRCPCALGCVPAKACCFCPTRQDKSPHLRSLISTWLRIAIFETMSQPEGDQRLWYIIDELETTGPSTA